MDTQELAFIEAIHDDPRDDQVRLVYADWLEEHGEQERAEFIRLQCYEASTYGTMGLWFSGKRKIISTLEDFKLRKADPGFDSLRRRQEQLWQQHGSRWLRRPIPRGYNLLRAYRGFPIISNERAYFGLLFHRDKERKERYEKMLTKKLSKDWFCSVRIHSPSTMPDLSVLQNIPQLSEVVLVAGSFRDLSHQVRLELLSDKFIHRLESFWFLGLRMSYVNLLASNEP